MLDWLPGIRGTLIADSRAAQSEEERNVKQLRFFLLTALMLMQASRLPGQPPSLRSGQYGLPVVCNDGTISVNVARAFRNFRDMGFGSDQWVIEGWYNVDPGKCTKIGEREHYKAGGSFGEDSVTLLAFAFWDSTGVWGGIKIQDRDPGLFYPIYPSNQQLCVQRGAAFRYTRDSPKQIDLARECDRAPAGYLLIPASLMYKGSTCAFAPNCGPDSAARLHVKLGPSDRAISVGPQSSSGGAAPGPGTSQDLQAILRDTIRGPGAPGLRGSPAGSFVEVCVPSAVVTKQS